jgi:hypothetical protein
MEIVHRVCYWDSWNRPLKQRLETAQIKYKASEDPSHKDFFISFDIAESHPFWKDIAKLQRGPIGWLKYGSIWDTYFSESEILSSEWSRIFVENVKKYPEPRSTWATDPANFDNFCKHCGTHVQARPFRIQREPNWGHFHFFTFFWGHAVFARKEVFDAFRRNKIRGGIRMDMVIHRTGVPTKDIFQLVPSNTTRGGLIAEKNIKMAFCRKCGNKKYSYHDRGVMRYRRDPIMQEVDVLYTNEWIGVGRKDAWREILVSNKLARLIIQQGWKGVRFKAVEIV